MGNCHSSQDTRGTAHYAAPQVRTTPPQQSYYSSMPTNQNQQYQPQQQTEKQSPWAPPPYTTEAPTKSATSVGSDSAYSFLREFDTIFLVDDSSSMLGKRWREAEDAIAAIAPICTQYDGDGIDIYFLNHQRGSRRGALSGYTNIGSADAVRRVFRSVKPCGATPVGNRLAGILRPYMKRLNHLTTQGKEHSIKPLNIIVITDGVFTDDAESIIAGVAKQLDSMLALPWQVGIQFFQVGDDEPARKYLQDLDDGLGEMARNERMRDIVDTVTWKGDRGRTLDADGILKCVIGAVNRKYDKRDATR